MSNTTVHSEADEANLSPLARRQVESLFVKIDRADEEREMCARERKRRPAGSDFSDLTRRERAAQTAWDESIFALQLTLGKSPNEAVLSTHAGFITEPQEHESPTAPPAIVLPFPVQPEPPVEQDDPWMTSRESAERARALSTNGHISSGWRKKMRQLESLGFAHRQGDHTNSELRTRRSTVDAVISGALDLDAQEGTVR